MLDKRQALEVQDLNQYGTPLTHSSSRCFSEGKNVFCRERIVNKAFGHLLWVRGAVV